MPEHYDGCAHWRHFYADKPEDFARMVANGWIWMLSPATQQHAVEMLVAGTLPMNAKVPPKIAAWIEAQVAQKT